MQADAGTVVAFAAGMIAGWIWAHMVFIRGLRKRGLLKEYRS